LRLPLARSRRLPGGSRARGALGAEGLAGEELVALLCALPVVGLAVWWALDEGGYRPLEWQPGTLVVLGVLVAAGLGGAAAVRTRAAAVAVAAAAGYTAWSYLSVLWADAPGTALEGSHRTLLYAAVLCLFALLPWSARVLTGVVAAWCLAIAAIGVSMLFRLAGTDAPLELFNDGRLAEPLGYQNATAALWTLAAFPSLVLAARPETPVLLRPLLLASSGLLLELAVLSQSRGWLLATPVVAVALLALTPQRVRLALFALPVAIAGGLALPRLLDPYAAASGLGAAEQARALVPTLDPLVEIVAATAAGLLFAGIGMVLVDRSTEVPARVRVWSGRVAAGLAAAALLAGAGAAWAATDGDPGGRLQEAWEDFKAFEDTDSGPNPNRFASLGSTRYDFWRVAVTRFAERPVTGLGQDNFAYAYLEDRRSSFEEPRWIHSLPLRLLTHTGVVGALLAAALFGALLAAALSRSAPLDVRTARAAALAPLVVWLVHGSVDWLWEFPALSVPALAFAGAALVVAAPPVARRQAPAALLARTAVVAVAAAGAMAVAVAFFAERDVTRAATDWPRAPADAIRRLERAEDLAPLDPRPLLVAGVIAQRRGRLAESRAAFAAAAERDPRNWFAHFELGLVAGLQRDRTAARRALLEARERNPRDATIALALVRLRQGRPLSLAEADREYTTRVQRRLGKPRTG
jgi:tetratricopeptide (TPR) repeat protein